jgi:hypothetical protein
MGPLDAPVVIGVVPASVGAWRLAPVRDSRRMRCFPVATDHPDPGRLCRRQGERPTSTDRRFCDPLAVAGTVPQAVLVGSPTFLSVAVPFGPGREEGKWSSTCACALTFPSERLVFPRIAPPPRGWRPGRRNIATSSRCCNPFVLPIIANVAFTPGGVDLASIVPLPPPCLRCLGPRRSRHPPRRCVPADGPLLGAGHPDISIHVSSDIYDRFYDATQ